MPLGRLSMGRTGAGTLLVYLSDNSASARCERQEEGGKTHTININLTPPWNLDIHNPPLPIHPLFQRPQPVHVDARIRIGEVTQFAEEEDDGYGYSVDVGVSGECYLGKGALEWDEEVYTVYGRRVSECRRQEGKRRGGRGREERGEGKEDKTYASFYIPVLFNKRTESLGRRWI